MKNILSVAFVLLFGFSMHSQVYTGAKAGAVFSNLSSFDGDFGSIDTEVASALEDGNIGYFFGFFAGIPINDKLTFQPEFQFLQQGNSSRELRLDYLQLPLALNYKLGEKFFANIGPQIGLRVWTSGDSNRIDTFDYSVFGTIGYDINSSIFVEARYSLGLNDIVKSSNIPLESSEGAIRDASFKNSYVYIGVGYRL